MAAQCDLAVIGGGPAGLAAASAAAESGADVVLLDEQDAPGGQIYRAVERVAAVRPGGLDLFGRDYAEGWELAQRLRESGAAYRPNTTVWQITPDRRLVLDGPEGPGVLAAKEVLLATGAVERPVPIPGWTLPGVMTAGAVQVLAKQSAAVPDGQVVLAGGGPLLYLVASQLLAAGVGISALLETAPSDRLWRALPHLPSAWFKGRAYIDKGRAMLDAIRRAGVARFRGIAGLAAEAGPDARLRAVSFNHGGRRETLKADLLMLHEGVIPNVQMTLALGCSHRWDTRQQCWQPVFDAWGVTDVPGVAVAGDGAWIGGAAMAALSGEIAALGALHRLGLINTGTRDLRAVPMRRRATAEAAVRPFLDVLYRPADWVLEPESDDTLVCRCEEVTAGAVRAALDEGCASAADVKAFTRCGMGPCQGRMCQPTVCRMIARARGVGPGAVAPARPRFPVKPVPLRTLAALADDGDGPGAPDWM